MDKSGDCHSESYNPSEERRTPAVIITGASSGFGRAFAQELDVALPPGDVFWLIARHGDALKRTAAAMTHRTVLLPLDLERAASFEILRERLEQENPSVRFLINNAGKGATGYFAEEDAAAHQALCDLNVRAQILMTAVVLPFLTQGSSIVFTASVAAFLPQPGFAAYAASKAMILSFARALREELRPQGIRVAVTCPNPMMTAFFSDAEKEAFLHSYKRAAVEDPAVAARKTMAALRRGKTVIVTSFWGKAVRLLSGVLPVSLTVRVIGRLFRKTKTGRVF